MLQDSTAAAKRRLVPFSRNRLRCASGRVIAVDIANNADKEILVRHPTAARRAFTRAFTMVEMLVTISIVVILVALGILAYSHVDRAMLIRSTRADLQMAQGFLDEYNGGPGLSQLGMGANSLDQSFPYKGGTFPIAGGGNNGPIGGTASDKQTNVLTGNVSVAGDQRVPTPSTQSPSGGALSVMWDMSYNPASDTTHNAIYNTGEVMVFLMRLPAVAQTVTKLPSTKLLTIGGSQLSYSTGPTSLSAPILVDGWGNPIIFVPAGGLITKVTAGTGSGSGSQLVLVRSSGTILLGVNNSYSAKNPPPLKDNDHPFWASAGPDGDFYGDKNNGGDDNMYSFQQ